jgi:Flp pilus assembly protein TadG
LDGRPPGGCRACSVALVAKAAGQSSGLRRRRSLLALAVAADYASVSRFRTRVQLAADAASLAAAESIAGHPDRARGGDADDLASRAAAAAFVRYAPRGAGSPTVAVNSRAAAVTATVGYAGLAPSNFGSALGYDAISVDALATSLMRVADSRSTAAR